MRLTILALFICAATTALCQSTVPGNPYNSPQKPPAFTWPGTDFSTVPPLWNGFGVSRPKDSLPTISLTRRLDRTQIDPRIVIHPPKSSLGTQSPGTLVAQNQYPGLQFLPIDASRKKMETIPPIWPNLKLQPIPIVWPNFKLLPVDAQALDTPSTPTK